MKVLHINTFSRGGAGIAVKRIHSGLLSKGIKSAVLTLDDPGDFPEAYSYYSVLNPVQRFLFKIIDNFSLRKYRYTRSINRTRETEFEKVIYTSPFSKFHLEKHPLVKQADIIHLHWIAGFIDYPTFFHEIHKPLVWTMHDMNPFMGGGHYRLDMDLQNKKLIDLENEFLKLKKKLYSNVSFPFFPVSPSQWLAREASDSKIFGKRMIHVIPNGVRIKKIKDTERKELRVRFNFQENIPVILFIADSLENKRKGFLLLLNAIRELSNSDFHFISIGSVNKEIWSINGIKNFGLIEDEELLTQIICAADLVVIPSLEDNLPNVMLEAFSCGTPVLAFPVGGMKEHVKDGLNGFLTDSCTEISLIEALKKFKQGKIRINKKEVIEYASSNFSLDEIANQYITLYKYALT